MEVTKLSVLTLSLLSMVDGNSSHYEVCPTFDCLPEYIPPDCRKRDLFMGSDGNTVCTGCDTSLCDRSCPQLICPEIYIPPKCRKPNYVIAADGITKCSVCDSSICGDRREVCPKLNCTEKIPRRCRVKQRSIGDDGLTICRACDKNGCED